MVILEEAYKTFVFNVDKDYFSGKANTLNCDISTLQRWRKVDHSTYIFECVKTISGNMPGMAESAIDYKGQWVVKLMSDEIGEEAGAIYDMLKLIHSSMLTLISLNKAIGHDSLKYPPFRDKSKMEISIKKSLKKLMDQVVPTAENNKKDEGSSEILEQYMDNLIASTTIIPAILYHNCSF